MKKAVLFIFILLSAGMGYAQNAPPIDWETYREKYIGPRNSYDYISYAFRTKPGVTKYYCYFKSGNKTVLAIFENSSLVKQTIYDSLNLFKLVKKNMGALKKIRNNHVVFYKDNDPNEKHLGIKFRELHFGHYRKKSAEFINALKNEKLKKGFTTINLLLETIEKE